MIVQACVSGGSSLSGSRHAQLNTLGIMPLIGGLMSPATCLHMTAQPMGGFVMSCGIYQIRNKLNRKCYIGSSTNIQCRRRRHLSRLRRGVHCNVHLQRAFDKYGEDTFAFEILEQVATMNLVECEQHYLDTLQPEYNMLPAAGSPLGYHHSLETRRKMSESRKGKGNPNYGKPLSPEHRRKLSETLSGERSPNYGKHHSIEWRRKIGDGNRGKCHSEETKQKLREAAANRPFSEEHRRKISEAGIGRRHSEATRRRMSVARKAYWRRIRAEQAVKTL